MEAAAAIQDITLASACVEALFSLCSAAAVALDLEALRANLPNEWDSLASIDTTALTTGPDKEDHPGHPYHHNLPSSCFYYSYHIQDRAGHKVVPKYITFIVSSRYPVLLATMGKNC